MATYPASFLFVCETVFPPDVGCGVELLIERARGVDDAQRRARGLGWLVEESDDLTLCPECRPTRP